MNREIEEIKKQIEVKKNEDFKSTDDYMAEVITKTKTQRYFNSILEDSFKEKESKGISKGKQLRSAGRRP